MPIVTSTGETVNVLVSDSFAPDAVTPESWAEFLVKLVHGPELASLTTYIAPLDEIRLLCGNGALGCYRQNRSVALGETLPDGTTPEEVVRHEYGHHIALYRSNSPWQAIDWGPKNWASAADICARVGRNEAFPGDEDEHYAQNPGEAWAETYRLMDERKAGITTATWPIIAPSLYPTEAALVAAEKDVVQPWTAGTAERLPQVRREGQDVVDPALDAARRLARRDRTASARRRAPGRARGREPADHAQARCRGRCRRAPHQGHRLRPALPVRTGKPERQAGTRDRRRGDAVARAVLPTSRST